MAAEVRFTLSATEHSTLRALLKLEAQTISEEQFKGVLATLGYRTQAPLAEILPVLAEKLAAAIE